MRSACVAKQSLIRAGGLRTRGSISGVFNFFGEIYLMGFTIEFRRFWRSGFPRGPRRIRGAVVFIGGSASAHTLIMRLLPKHS